MAVCCYFQHTLCVLTMANVFATIEKVVQQRKAHREPLPMPQWRNGSAGDL